MDYETETGAAPVAAEIPPAREPTVVERAIAARLALDAWFADHVPNTSLADTPRHNRIAMSLAALKGVLDDIELGRE